MYEKIKIKMNNLSRLKVCLSEIDKLEKLKYWSSVFLEWKNNTLEIVKQIYWETSENLEVFKLIKYDFQNTSGLPEEIRQEKYLNWLIWAKKIISNFIESLNELKSEDLKILENIFNRFTIVSKQLENNRHWWRDTIKIEDEYDVQDLLHWLLKLYFNDICDEEWNNSFAGKNSRVDFLLKDEKIMIEVKKTRVWLKDEKVWEEIVLDIAKYKWNKDCELLVCFIYDPDNLIKNPRGLEKDLENTEDLKIKVFIRN